MIRLAFLAALAAIIAVAPIAQAQPLRITIPSRDEKPEKIDPRCAAEGPGFIYIPASGTCLRIGGLVGVEVGRGQSGNLLPR